MTRHMSAALERAREARTALKQGAGASQFAAYAAEIRRGTGRLLGLSDRALAARRRLSASEWEHVLALHRLISELLETAALIEAGLDFEESFGTG